jgi:hypothetical protein
MTFICDSLYRKNRQIPKSNFIATPSKNETLPTFYEPRNIDSPARTSTQLSHVYRDNKGAQRGRGGIGFMILSIRLAAGGAQCIRLVYGSLICAAGCPRFDATLRGSCSIFG